MTSDRATSGRWRVTRVDETGSTNADLAAMARAGERDGAVLVARHQTAGRGRLGRSWSAPPDASLLVSVLVVPPVWVPLHAVTQAVGLAASTACARVANVDVELKWPNDLMVGPRKLAGVLAEAVVLPSATTPLRSVVVGMGLNVAWPPGDELPDDLRERVVALNHLGADVTVDDVLAAYLDALAGRIDQMIDDPPGLLAAYRAALATIGCDVRVELPGGEVVGRAVGLDRDGGLLVETGAGTTVVSAGDVVHLRPS